MNTKIFIKNSEIEELIGIEETDFPKYSTQILNLANQNSQGTRPKVVGQMSELIQEFSGQSLSDWEKWYIRKYPNAIKDATKKIFEMVNNFKGAMQLIDEKLVEDWVRDLVIIKTFVGLKFQESILKRISLFVKKSYRLANPEEESNGIDGYIGDTPVSIKPDSYKTEKNLQEQIDANIIYYKKNKRGLEIEFDSYL